MGLNEKSFQMQVLKTLAQGQGALVEVGGFLDAHTVAGFEKQMNALVDNQASRIILDLSKLNYISSAGIGAMMSLLQRLRRESGDLVLWRPSPKVFKILELLGFTGIFRIAATEEEAWTQLRIEA